jgi:hypothetical protein
MAFQGVVMSKQELLAEAMHLPLEDRIVLAQALTESFNTMHPDADAYWREEVLTRQKQFRSGEYDSLTYDEFFRDDTLS